MFVSFTNTLFNVDKLIFLILPYFKIYIATLNENTGLIMTQNTGKKIILNNKNANFFSK